MWSFLDVSATIHITFIEYSNTYVAMLVMLDIGIVKTLSDLTWSFAGPHIRLGVRACCASRERDRTLEQISFADA